MSRTNSRQIANKKHPEYKLLSSKGYSDDQRSSEEETIFASPSMTVKKSSKGSDGWSTMLVSFLKRNRGIASAGILLLILVFAMLFVIAIMFEKNGRISSAQLNDTGGADIGLGEENHIDDSQQQQQQQQHIEKLELSWSRDFDPSYSELSLLEHDINQDGVSDLILDSMTWRMGQDKYLVCPEKPNSCREDLGFSPCRAQLLALDGANGTIIWEKWVEFSTFAANCKHDLNLDGVPDCTFSGRVGLLVAINPVDGSYIWVVDPAVTFPMYSYYSPLFIRDFDRDGVIDLIVTHGGDPTYHPEQKQRSPGYIFVISGRSGQQLSELVPMPDGHETYSSPVAYNATDVELVLFGSGGETVTGSLWAISVESFQKHVDEWTPNRAEKYRFNRLYFDPLCLSLKEINSMRPQHSKDSEFKYLKKKQYWMTLCAVWSKNSRVMWNPYKLCVYEFVSGRKTGIMQPPVVVDVNGDNIKDLLVSHFNDDTILIDGASVDTLWNHSAVDIQSYSIPAPLHYNSDDQLDFLVRFSKGKWMFYDYSYMGVLDGTNGELIWTLNCSMGAMSSPITIKSQKNGHDGMLFLANGCENPTSQVSKRGEFSTLNDDICRQGHTEDEYLLCKSKNDQKRHEENADDEAEETDFSNIVNNIPADLWETKSEEDDFPDPWTATRSFVQEYCDVPYDAMINRVYYFTPNMIKLGKVEPLFENKPYVYKPPSSGYLNSKKRRDVNASTEDEGSEQEQQQSLKSRKDIRCAHILLPWKLQSTPIIGDFDKDGRLDAATSVLFDGMPNESYRLSTLHPPKVSVKAFNIEDKLIEVFGPNIKDVVDFNAYYPASKQPWKQYMGSRGNGIYETPNSS